MTDRGGSSEVISASPERILAVLMDFESYPQWQTGVVRTVVHERDDQGRGVLVETYVDIKIRKVRFTARYSYQPDGLSWDFVSGEMRDNSGRYTLTELGAGRTRVSCDISFAVDFYIPRILGDRIKDQSVKASIRGLKRRAESRSR